MARNCGSILTTVTANHLEVADISSILSIVLKLESNKHVLDKMHVQITVRTKSDVKSVVVIIM